MENLQKILSNQWPDFIEHFNNILTKETLLGTSWKNFATNLKTQERTKILSPFFIRELVNFCNNSNFILCEENHKDLKWFKEDIEKKLTLSINESWTGNGFKKVNWHMLTKLKLDNNCLIEKSLCCLIPLDECISKWSSSGEGDNFSNLVIRNSDYDKLLKIHGDFYKNRVNLTPILL
jgi:hypothetical protein